MVLLLVLPLCTKKLKKRKKWEIDRYLVNNYVGKTRTNTEVQRKCRKQRKTGKLQQVIEEGGVQVGTCEGPGRCQPSPLRKKDPSMLIIMESFGFFLGTQVSQTQAVS